MNKTDDRRASMIDRLADHVLAEGLSASSLRPLAEAAGTSDRMLLYYFRDKSEIIAATLERVSVRFAGHLEAQLDGRRLPYEQLRRKIVKAVIAPESWPYMSVWLEIAANAARHDPFYRAVGEQIARGFLGFAEARLDVPAAKRKREALKLLIAVEGAMLLKSMGLDEVTLL